MKQGLLRAIICSSVVSYSSPVISGPSQFSGPLNTLGNVSTQQTILSATVNPAAGEYVMGKSISWGYLTSLGFDVEFGDVDDLVDSFDTLVVELDRLDNEANTFGEIVTLGEVEAVRDQSNDFLVELGRKGTMKVGVQTRVPLFPISIRSEKLNGVVTLDAHINAEVAALFVDRPLEIVAPDILAGEFNFGLTTDTIVALSSAEMSTYSIGYSYDLANSHVMDGLGNKFLKVNDRLLLGAKLSYYQANLSSLVVAIDQEDDNDDLWDLISDGFDDNQVKTNEFGLDLGILWVSERFLIGATWKNINEPSFKSSRLGENCLNFASPDLRNSCNLAISFAAEGRLDLNPEYVMERQISIEGTVFTSNKHWVFAAGYDLNGVSGPVQDEYKWMTGSVSYFLMSYWIPSVRVGFRSNLEGTELNFVNMGFTILGGIHADLSTAIDSVKIDGDELPKSFSLNIGFERKF